MSSKHEKDKQKALQEKYQAILYGLLRDEDNKYCVDCDAKGPRWAAWNLGVFLCIRCAGIHRNLGVHVSRVKSVNLDSWTEEQVAMMMEIGNSRGRAVYEANIPDNFRRPQTDSSLEAFIRAKYEQKKYIASEWIPPKPKALVLPPDNSTGIPSKPMHNSAGVKDSKVQGRLSSNQSKPHDTPKMTSSSASNTPSLKVHKPTHTPVQAEIVASKNGVMDLLGLDDPIPIDNSQKDIFGEFLSGTISLPPQQQQPMQQQQQQSVAGSDLADIVVGNSQPGDSSVNPNDMSLFDSSSAATGQPTETKKVSKDAILALYGPSQPPPPNVYGGGLMMDPNHAMMGHMALMPGQPINGQIPIQPPMLIGQHPMMGGVTSMAAMMNPQVPLMMSGGPQLQGIQMNPNLYNMQQVQNQFTGLNLGPSQPMSQAAFFHQGVVQPIFNHTPLAAQQINQNSPLFNSASQQGAYQINTPIGMGAVPTRPSPGQIPNWGNCLPHQPAHSPMTGNFWQ